jgi:hypothetical protein
MIKKLSLLLVTAAVLAFAAPALANAATGLTEQGKLIPVGSKLDYTSVGHVTITSTKTGNITCEKATLTGEVVVNTLARVLVVGVPGRSSFTNCTVPSGASVVVTNVAVSSEEATGGGTVKTSLSFEADIGTITCKYSTSSGTATYNPAETAEGGKEVTYNEVPLTVTPAACGTTAKLDGKFTRETDETNVHVFLM